MENIQAILLTGVSSFINGDIVRVFYFNGSSERKIVDFTKPIDEWICVEDSPEVNHNIFEQ